MVGQGKAAGTGDHGMHGQIPQFFICFGKQVGEGLLYIGKMSLIVGKEYLMPVIQNGNLDCGRTNVNAKRILHFTHFLYHSFYSLYLFIMRFDTRCHYTTQSIKMQLSNS